MFDAGQLPPNLLEELGTLRYAPCLALLVTLRGPSDVPAAVTVHLGPAFSAEHYEKTATELATRVLPAVQRWLGADVADVHVHRWKFSEPTTTHRAPSIWLPDLGVGFAGDAFGGPRVEGAAFSGLDLADRITGDRRDAP